VLKLTSVLWLGLTLGAQTPVELWRYTHPETQVLVGVDWGKARTSATGKMLARKLAGTGALKAAPVPLDLSDKIERVLISTSGAVTAADAQPPVVVAVEGRFDRVSLKKTMPAGTASERFQGVELYVPPKSKAGEMLLAVVSEQVLLLGDRASLGRVLASKGYDGPLKARAAQLAGQCEIWAVAEGGMNVKQLDEVKGIDFGLTLQKGLGLNLRMVTESEEAAKKLGALGQLVSGMVAQDAKQNPEISAVMKSLSVKTEGATLQMSLDVPLATLERGVTEMASSFRSTGPPTLESLLGMRPQGGLPPGLRPVARPAGVVVSTAPVTPAVPQKRTIRIQGGEDGPKEITYVK